MYAHDEIIALLQKILSKGYECTGWNNHKPVNNFSQNIENLAYFEKVLKPL